MPTESQTHLSPLCPTFANKHRSYLKSFALPKTPPTEPGIKRLAIQTKDHSIEYADFEGEIPEGHYGAGTVTIWDRAGLSSKNSKRMKKYSSNYPATKCRAAMRSSKQDWRG